MNIFEKQFDKLKSIGGGSQGDVFLCKDRRLERVVAIKSLHPKLVNNPTNKRRFKEEAKLLAQLKDERIITLYDYIEDATTLHLILEYAEGVHLGLYIEKNKSIQLSRALNIFIQVVKAVDYAHTMNILHRDIKPANIMLDSDDNIKIIDFGIGKNEKSNHNVTVLTQGTNPGYTPRYMTPEHVLGNAITKASDIYSLGVTFWEMLSGKKPYIDVSGDFQLKTKIQSEPLPYLDHIPKKINDIIEKATLKDPKLRYSSCKAFIRDLEQYHGDDTKATEKPENKIEFNISGPNNPVVVINNKGIVGNEFSYYAKSGEKIKITIEKNGFQKYYKQFVSNSNKERVLIRLKKDNSLNSKFLFVLILFFLLLIITFLILK